jgi:hypothetical protein
VIVISCLGSRLSPVVDVGDDRAGTRLLNQAIGVGGDASRDAQR